MRYELRALRQKVALLARCVLRDARGVKNPYQFKLFWQEGEKFNP